MRCPACQTQVDDGAKACPSCGENLARHAEAATVADAIGLARAGQAGSAAQAGQNGSSSRPKPPADEGERFTPGDIVATRFRILRLLGTGGMGRVYHAYDLKLGQPVALKVLKPCYAGKPSCIDHLRSEVRIARSIAHPNICRVYDLNEDGDIAFLSMEYIDGEDLASMLRRVGRMAKERAIEAARQLVAALQGAHDRGVLHRDLKPANVMIDGQGNLRIMDFGIAAAIGEVADDAETGSPGTPAYMAPEVLSGGKASVQSDLFSLGLVLYELFTGKPVYDARTMTELFRQHRRESPQPPSSVVEIDPELERTILWCLQRDPSKRPPSALAVLAALPGGDPLRAALEAGETPSPELVAASGGSGRTPWRVVAGLLAAIVVCVGLVFAIAPFTKLTGYVDTELSPEVLAHTSREMLSDFGYPGAAGRSEAFGFEIDTEVLTHYRRAAAEGGRTRFWSDLAKGFPEPLRFFYRSAPDALPLIAKRLAERVTWSDPPEDPQLLQALQRIDLRPPVPSEDDVEAVGSPPSRSEGREEWLGSIRLRLSNHGQLRELRVIPSNADVERARQEPTDPAKVEGLREQLFELAGCSEYATEVDPIEPHPYADTTRAWKSFFVEPSETAVHMEVGLLGGRPVSFICRGLHAHVDPRDSDSISLVRWVLNNLINVGVSLVALVLAGMAVARGRYDRIGGFRIAIGSCVIIVVANLMHGNDVIGGSAAHMDQFYNTFARGLLLAAHTWMFYVALESQVRRVWPEMLIGWMRLLSGRIRDPLVGRSILIGLIAGSFGSFVQHLDRLLPQVLEGRDTELPVWFVPATVEQLAGGSVAFGSVLESSVLLFRYTLILVTLLTVMCWLFRSRRIAMVAFVALQATLFSISADSSIWSVPLFLAVALVGTWIIVRHGMLTAFVAGWTWALLYGAPLIVDPGHFAFESTVMVLLTIVVLAVFGALVAGGYGRQGAHAIRMSTTPAPNPV